MLHKKIFIKTYLFNLQCALTCSPVHFRTVWQKAARWCGTKLRQKDQMKSMALMAKIDHM